MNDADVDALCAEFTPMNASSVRDHCGLVDGVLEVVAALRRHGLRIGSTTGYNCGIMDVVLPLVAAQGYAPDNLVCAGVASVGRHRWRCIAASPTWACGRRARS